LRVADTSLPTARHWLPLAAAIGSIFALSLLVLSRVSTLEPVGFTLLFKIGTAACFGLALLALGHTTVLWHHTHAALTRLGTSFLPKVPLSRRSRNGDSAIDLADVAHVEGDIARNRAGCEPAPISFHHWEAFAHQGCGIGAVVIAREVVR
jgi:hypothetical protein